MSRHWTLADLILVVPNAAKHILSSFFVERSRNEAFRHLLFNFIKQLPWERCRCKNRSFDFPVYICKLYMAVQSFITIKSQGKKLSKSKFTIFRLMAPSTWLFLPRKPECLKNYLKLVIQFATTPCRVNIEFACDYTSSLYFMFQHFVVSLIIFVGVVHCFSGSTSWNTVLLFVNISSL